MVKWSSRYRPDTVERHRDVERARGAVWWGLISSNPQSDWRVSEQWVNRLRQQIVEGVETHVFISGDTRWKTRLNAVEYAKEGVETDLIPSYYATEGDYHLWVKISDFEMVERDQLIRLLDPVNQPGRPVALGNQTNPLIVRLRTTPRVWWVNQGTSFARARSGGYLWAPLTDKSGRTKTTGRHCDISERAMLCSTTPTPRFVGGAPSKPPRFHRRDLIPMLTRAGTTRVSARASTYHDLSERVRLSAIPIEWRTAEGGPFTKDGAVKQGYLFNVSDKFAQRLQQRFPQLDFQAQLGAVVDEPAEIGSPAATGELEVDAVLAAVTARGLRISPSIIGQAVAALRSGKHVIFTGPPGTAKTTLAELIAAVARPRGCATATC